MSRTFSYTPDVSPPEGSGLDLDLAYTLEAYFKSQDTYFDDGYLQTGHRLGLEIVPFLHGVRIATDDADLQAACGDLIEAIERHGAVIVEVRR